MSRLPNRKRVLIWGPCRSDGINKGAEVPIQWDWEEISFWKLCFQFIKRDRGKSLRDLEIGKVRGGYLKDLRFRVCLKEVAESFFSLPKTD